MSKASRDKGKRGEREFATLLRKHGFTASRAGYKQAAGDGTADIACPALDGEIHFEVKRVEKLNLWAALAQAENDAQENKMRWPVTPAVAFKRNRSSWYVVLPVSDLLHYLRFYLTYKGNKNDTE